MPKQISDDVIFKATMRLLVEQGYVGATTRQIAEEAGINEVTLFRKFGSKADLVAEAVAHEVGQIAVEELAYTGDVAADLRQIVQLYQGAVTQYGDFFPVLMAEIPRYPELRSALRAPLRLIKTIARVLERYQEEGILRREPPLQAVSGLLGPVIVLTLIRETDPGLEIAAPDLEALLAGFLHGRLQTGGVPPEG